MYIARRHHPVAGLQRLEAPGSCLQWLWTQRAGCRPNLGQLQLWRPLLDTTKTLAVLLAAYVSCSVSCSQSGLHTNTACCSEQDAYEPRHGLDDYPGLSSVRCSSGPRCISHAERAVVNKEEMLCLATESCIGTDHAAHSSVYCPQRSIEYTSGCWAAAEGKRYTTCHSPHRHALAPMAGTAGSRSQTVERDNASLIAIMVLIVAAKTRQA